MKHVAIYVPGIRDDIGKLQSLLIQSWRLRGVRPVMHEFPWAGPETFETKLQRLVSRIDAHRANGSAVSLVGASAGATAVMQAFMLRRNNIKHVVFICGKLHGMGNVSSQTYARNPAFRAALGATESLGSPLSMTDLAKLLSLYSNIDRVVPHADTITPGVTERQTRPLPHGRAILHTISFGAGAWLDYVKQ